MGAILTLKTRAIHEINDCQNGSQTTENNTLNISKIACVYGDFSTDLCVILVV